MSVLVVSEYSSVKLTANLICPRPLVQICAGSHVVKAAIPENSAYGVLAIPKVLNVSQRTSRDGADQRTNNSSLSKHLGDDQITTI